MSVPLIVYPWIQRDCCNQAWNTYNTKLWYKTPLERRVRSISCSLTKNKSLPSPIMIFFALLFVVSFAFCKCILMKEVAIFYELCIGMMLLVCILFIDTSLHKPVDWFTEFSLAWGQAMSKLGGSWYVQFASLFYIIIYCYSLIYFILWTWYLCYFVYFAWSMIMRGITVGVRILLEKHRQGTIFLKIQSLGQDYLCSYFTKRRR